jgi:hypothetical protein
MPVVAGVTRSSRSVAARTVVAAVVASAVREPVGVGEQCDAGDDDEPADGFAGGGQFAQPQEGDQDGDAGHEVEQGGGCGHREGPYRDAP